MGLTPSRLTTKEISKIEDILRAETVTAKKAAVFSEMVQDPELRDMLDECSREARRRVRHFASEVEV